MAEKKFGDWGENISSESWDQQVRYMIGALTKEYSKNNEMVNVLNKWHRDVTLKSKHDKDFSPHVNGFYMIFMSHGTWYDNVRLTAKYPITSKNLSEPTEKDIIGNNPDSYLNFMATDIDVPDITEEYISVSSRMRNSFIPSRNYFVSDFNISYVENNNLDVIRYHEHWMKYMNLVKRGEETKEHFGVQYCKNHSNGYFLDMPYTNAVWVAVFKPFTMQIQLLIKLVGVMPVTMPLKQVVGNRSSTKMTVLNMSYKAADLQYKFYNSNDSFLADEGFLAKSFRKEIAGNFKTTT